MRLLFFLFLSIDKNTVVNKLLNDFNTDIELFHTELVNKSKELNINRTQCSIALKPIDLIHNLSDEPKNGSPSLVRNLSATDNLELIRSLSIDYSVNYKKTKQNFIEFKYAINTYLFTYIEKNLNLFNIIALQLK